MRSTIASHSLRTRRLHGSGDELLEAMYGELLIPLREMAHIVEMLTTADERNALDLVREGQLAPDPLVTVRADRERFDDPDPPVQLLTLTDAVLTAAPPHPRARATHAA
ncbi:hypothetical protein [Cellulomonas chitinilytica]|uniref:hypothetical protein n=1 Tax=Cellulomonas chitinilytica TaxID=398759 RepID=UPI0019432904|nr:hypothetical protein [Cellulomonas chitinilytica]